MFFRILVLTLVLAVAWQIGWRLWRIRQKQQRATLEKMQTNTAKQGKMLRCDYCDVHFPEQEAVRVENKVFCCDQHQVLFEKKTDAP